MDWKQYGGDGKVRFNAVHKALRKARTKGRLQFEYGNLQMIPCRIEPSMRCNKHAAHVGLEIVVGYDEITVWVPPEAVWVWIGHENLGNKRLIPLLEWSKKNGD